jgi:hypothetical protein
MLRHLGVVVICACIVASIGCDGSTGPSPLPPASPPAPNSTVNVTFSGRVVNADTGAPLGDVRVSVAGSSGATSGGDGTFTLSFTFPSSRSSVYLELTRPGYDDRGWRVEPNMAGTPAELGMYPTLVVRPGESIEMRVQDTVNRCVFGGGYACRRVLVEASPGDPVELEIVPRDPSKPMALTENLFDEEADLRLKVPPGGLAYVVFWDSGGAREGRLIARR